MLHVTAYWLIVSIYQQLGSMKMQDRKMRRMEVGLENAYRQSVRQSVQFQFPEFFAPGIPQ